MTMIRVTLTKPLDGNPIGSTAEFSKADFERLEARGAVKRFEEKQAPESTNQTNPPVSNQSDPPAENKDAPAAEVKPAQEPSTKAKPKAKTGTDTAD